MVIEDCAHALGATYEGRPVGSSGNFCVFSTQAIKHLTTICGGLLVCPNERLYSRGKLIRWFGIDRNRRSGAGHDFRMEPDIAEWGFRFHMNDVAATVGLVNLKHIPRLLARCQANGDFYDEQFENLPHTRLLRPTRGGRSACWIYTMRVAASTRPAFIRHMMTRGIVVSAVHQRNDVHSCVAQYSALLPNLNVLADEIICLPVGWWLSDADRDRVVSAVRDFSASVAEQVSQVSGGSALSPRKKKNSAKGGRDAGASSQGASYGSTLPRALSVPAHRQRCIITGGCGFIGHHVVEHFVKNTDFEILVLDKLWYASIGYDRLMDSGVFHCIQARLGHHLDNTLRHHT